ncbi:MAG: lysylphosphatidylglycerol synthase transmembrane domain-containing protein [Cyclobacteriaceae bacterium]
MTQRFQTLLQYLVLMVVSVFLVWYSLKAIHPAEEQGKWGYLLQTWHMADKGWLMLMALLAMISHVIRAERWRMLIEPTGHPVSLYHSFLSLMMGYLVNLVVPRGGEVSRCYNLYKLDRCPFDKTLGTVVTERAIDLICFVLILLAAFAVESNKLLGFIYSLPPLPVSGTNKWLTVLIFVVALALLLISLWLVFRKATFKEKILQFWQGFKSGLGTIFRLKHPSLFYFHSFVIWALYFAMSYTVIKAFDETSHLGWGAVLAVFAIGSIAMIIPLPGGTGSYHTLVPAGLAFLYQIPKADAVAFTFVFHAWQTLIMVVSGFLAIFSTYVIIRSRESNSG